MLIREIKDLKAFKQLEFYTRLVLTSFLQFTLCLSVSLADETIDFDTQIIPVLTKAGCNTGACHGAAVGRGGFRLSLYGGEPEFDFKSIVMELEGRRVNLAHPKKSLLLLKATESINHGGGARLEYDGESVKLIQRWIQSGTIRTQSSELVSLTVTPKKSILSIGNPKVRLGTTAVFANNNKQDVTKWTVFEAEDPESVHIDPRTAIATIKKRGRHIVTARFLDQIQAIELFIPINDQRFDYSEIKITNFIDQHILDQLKVLNLPVSKNISDRTFLRRVYLDLTGRLPTIQEQTQFVENSSPNRREELIDLLLASDSFTDYWTLYFSELLRLRSPINDKQAGETYQLWLKDQIANKTPYNQITQQLLLSLGDTKKNGPANFYRTVSGVREQAEFVSELFMGVRLRCANCHNHPLDQWTQDDYHGLAAIFAKVGQGATVTIKPKATVSHPRTGNDAIPKIPGWKFLESDENERESFAKWLTHQDNPYFAKSIVNRLWKQLMGRGFVEPTDDLRRTNPATHPELLNNLAEEFVSHQYSLRHIIKLIVMSSTYSRSCDTIKENEADDRFFSHGLSKKLKAEVFSDAVSDVTGVFAQFNQLPERTRAVTLFDANETTDSLNLLGRCSRKDTCEDGSSASPGLSQMLHLFNGSFLNQKIEQPSNQLHKMITAKKTNQHIIEAFYLRALCRKPTNRETEFWTKQIPASLSTAKRKEILQDFVWSLLTCKEFVTNH